MKNNLDEVELDAALFWQDELLDQIKITWPHVPHLSIGKLLSSAMEITLGEKGRVQITDTEKGMNPLYGRPEELISGLRALIPADWELEESK